MGGVWEEQKNDGSKAWKGQGKKQQQGEVGQLGMT